jgi:hypothetical protein
VPDHLRAGVQIRYADLAATAVTGLVTDPVTTVIDCARTLPFDEALSIGDSALRSRKVTSQARDGRVAPAAQVS